jgi:branched-subunit amino acid ABC-type transport system permease component
MFFLQILLNSLVMGTQVLFVAIPLYLIYSVSKIFHLAIGAIGTTLAYVVYFGMTHGWNIFQIGFVFMFVGLILSLISYGLLESHVRRKQVLFAMIISFSLGIIIESLLSIYFGTDGKIMVKTILPILYLEDIRITFPGMLIMIVGIFSSIFLTLLIKKTPLGRQVRSVSENTNYAEGLGVPVKKLRIYMYIFASFFAGFSSIMTGLNTALSPYMGFNIVILAFIAFLIGGTHDLRGTIVASYIIALIPQFIINYTSVSSSWKMFFVFIIASILLILRPQGLFVAHTRKSC